jgi:hypothetical protein
VPFISEFATPTNQSSPDGITLGSDGNLWFAERVNSFTQQTNLPDQLGKFVIILTGTPNQRYVEQLYLDLLHRTVDASGLATWVPKLDQGAGHFQVALKIIESPEHRDLVIQGYYHQFLDRAASPSELNAWQAFFDAGGTNEQAEATILGSDEFFAHVSNASDPNAFLENL